MCASKTTFLTRLFAACEDADNDSVSFVGDDGQFKILHLLKLLRVVCPANRLDAARGRLLEYNFISKGDDVWQHPQFFPGSKTVINIKSRRNSRSARSRAAAQPRPSMPRLVTTTKRKLSERSSLTVREYEAKRRKENKALGQWQAEMEADTEELRAEAARAHAVTMASFKAVEDGVKHNTTKVCAHTVTACIACCVCSS
jgi:hypothetical protein